MDGATKKPHLPPPPPTVGNSVNLFLSFFLPSDCKVLLCDFHCEQAWDRWLSKTSNGVRPYKEGILVYLRRIAKAESIDEFDKAVEALKESHIWGANYSRKFRSWFKNTWFSAKEVIVMNVFFITVKNMQL